MNIRENSPNRVCVDVSWSVRFFAESSNSRNRVSIAFIDSGRCMLLFRSMIRFITGMAAIYTKAKYAMCDSLGALSNFRKWNGFLLEKYATTTAGNAKASMFCSIIWIFRAVNVIPNFSVTKAQMAVVR